VGQPFEEPKEVKKKSPVYKQVVNIKTRCVDRFWGDPKWTGLRGDRAV